MNCYVITYDGDDSYGDNDDNNENGDNDDEVDPELLLVTSPCSRADGLAVKVASDFRPIRLLFPFGIKCRAPTSH